MGITHRRFHLRFLFVVGATLLLGGCGSNDTRPTPSCEVSADALDFGIAVVGDTLTRVVTLSNSGNANLSIALNTEGTDFGLTAGASTALSLAPGDTATLSVVFHPTSPGRKSGSLQFSGGPCTGVTLIGEGESPCSVRPDNLDFDRVSLGRPERQSFVVVNWGRLPLLGNVTASCSEFTIVEGGGAFSLSGGDSFQVVVELAATTLGTKTCTIDLGLPLCSTVSCAGQASKTWNVGADGSGDAPTVQAAIDSATSGEIVLVHPGTYYEVIDFKGKDIIVTSAEGPESAILDGSGFSGVAVVTFQSGESRAARFQGLTVRRGVQGIHIVEAQPTVALNVITENVGARYGAGIWCEVRDIDHGVWSPLIQANSVTKNTAGNICGGIGTWVGMTPEIVGNYVSENRAEAGDGGGVYFRGMNRGGAICGNVIVDNFAGDHGGGVYALGFPYGNPLQFELSRNLIARNTADGREGTGDSGGGVWLWETAAWVHHNTIVDNAGHGKGSPNGGGIAILRPSAPIIEQNLIAFSQAGGGIWCSGESTPVIRNNLAWMNVGGDGVGSCPSWWQANGNVVADPLFCDRTAGDYSLSTGSPALTHPAGPLGAIPGEGCQPTLVERTTWGSVKARYGTR